MEAVGWNKETEAQVDFVKPESQIENHLLVWHMKKLKVYIEKNVLKIKNYLKI